MRSAEISLCLFVLGGLVLPVFAHGSESVTESTRRGFTDGPEIPWYDAEQDALRKVSIRERAEPPSPSQWERKPKPTKKNNSSNWNWDFSWEGFWVFVQWLLYIALGVLAILAVWFLIKAYVRGEMRGHTVSAQPAESSAVADIERLENLPIDVLDEKEDLLAAARRRYEAGKFGEAIVFLFSYQLVELDKHHFLQLVKGKTNRQYLRELSSSRSLRNLLSDTVHVFEDFFFGKHTIGADRFQACWQQLDRFHELLAAENSG